MKSNAYFELSRLKLLEQYNILKDKADTVSFSFKTNPVVGEQLELLTNCWFSVHSSELLEKIKDKTRTLFFAQAWNKEEINDLFEKGVNRFVVDNKNDLRILLDYLKEENRQVETLFLRMKLKEHTIHTGKYFVFGLPAENINQLIHELNENRAVKSLGIHFHRKTQNISEWNLKEEIEQSLEIKTLEKIKFFNIGGGIPVEYVNSRVSLGYIFNEIEKLRQWLASFNISLITEPGRFLAAPCIKLKTRIKNIYQNNIVVDCSVYNSAMDTFIANIRLKVENELEKGIAYTIKGCTPCSMDILRYRVYLDNPKPGDTITFLNAGAYSFSTDFCLLKEIPIKIIK